MDKLIYKKVKKKSETTDRLMGVLAIITILLVWVAGQIQDSTNLEASFYKALPGMNYFEKYSDGNYAAYADTRGETLIGYISTGEASGYGGPMSVAVATDLDGKITGLSVVNQCETPSWFKRVIDSHLIKSLIGKNYADPIELDQDIDGISGATYTCRAMVDSVRKGSRKIAKEVLGVPLPESMGSTPLRFGAPEILLLILFIVGYLGHGRKFKYRSHVRWVCLLFSLIVFGFVYTAPLTLVNINQFLLGFWPEWQTHLYWYLLIGAIILVFTVDNKNLYCSWVCPFGAAQECMAVIGGAKVKRPKRFRSLFKWTHRGLAWLAIILALLFRNPGLTSYEIFGTLFDLSGSSRQFVLLALVLLTAMAVKRPWCRYLCPIRPVGDFIKMIRKWIKEVWVKWKKTPSQAI